MEDYIKRLKRRLIRLNGQKNILEAEHKNNEPNFTYHGGFSLGYLKGKISEIEDTIDDMEEVWKQIQS